MATPQTDSDFNNIYGYVPTRSVCYIFVVSFAISTVAHLVQALRPTPRASWLIRTAVVAGIAEMVGWAARTYSSYNPSNRSAYIAQSSVLVIAPTPFLAAFFIAFGRIAERVGPQYSRLSSKMYLRVFLTGDILSLFIQGGGGGLAAQGSNNPDRARLGSNIILAGLGIQMVFLTAFCFFMAEYVFRRHKNRPFHGIRKEVEPPVMNHSMQILMVCICISTAFIFVRSVYRIIEFADGFNGAVAHTQVLFNVFDGAMITLAMYVLNFMNAGMRLAATPPYHTEQGIPLTNPTAVDYHQYRGISPQ